MQPQSTPDPATLLRDIAPPVDVFPYPVWMVVVATLLALILIGLLVWWITRLFRKKKVAPPLFPHEIALRELAEARARIESTAPFEFSILVSGILRSYIGKRYGLPATRQTSPEFLAAAASSPLFSEEKRADLGAFLEKVDLIKFARIDATTADSLALCDAAEKVVRGGPPK